MIIKDKTITTIFIVPTLGIPKEDLKNNGFINAYLNDLKHEIEYKDCVFLVFKSENKEKFSEFLNYTYDNNPLLLDDYDNEQSEIILIFSINKEYEDDYKKILSGKYSETSKKYQKFFPETVDLNGKKEKSLQTMIFNKDPRLAKYWCNFLGTEIIINNELELWPILDLKKEILNYDENKEQISESLESL